MQAARTWPLSVLLVVACDASETPPAIELDRADEGGIEGTVRVDGEDIRVVSEDGTSSDPDRPGDERTLTVIGADGTYHAAWRIELATEDVIGKFAGNSFGLDPERDMDIPHWRGVASSRTSRVLDEVSRAAEAAMSSHPEASSHLHALSRVGPFLREMAEPPVGVINECGDGICDADEDDTSCAEDCGCSANACGSVAPVGCFCDATCMERGDCCADACQACSAGEVNGCPVCDGFECLDGTCIAAEGECNGAIECPESEDDEDLCGYGECQDSELACEDGQCLPSSALCNGVSECGGGDDEAYCATSRTAEDGMWPDGGAATAESPDTRGETLSAPVRPDDPEAERSKCRYDVNFKFDRRELSDCYWKWFAKACIRDIECGDRRPHIKIYQRGDDLCGSYSLKLIAREDGAPHGGFLCESVSKKWRKSWHPGEAHVYIKAFVGYSRGVWKHKEIESPGNDVCLF